MVAVVAVSPTRINRGAATGEPPRVMEVVWISAAGLFGVGVVRGGAGAGVGRRLAVMVSVAVTGVVRESVTVIAMVRIARREIDVDHAPVLAATTVEGRGRPIRGEPAVDVDHHACAIGQSDVGCPVVHGVIA